MGKTKIETSFMTLPCKLTDREFAERATSLGAAMADVDLHEEHVAQVKSELKARGEQLDAEVRRLSTIVRTKQEPRKVEVEIFADFATGVAWELRTDTHEEKSRPLTETERARAQIDFTAGESALDPVGDLAVDDTRREDPDPEVVDPLEPYQVVEVRLQQVDKIDDADQARLAATRKDLQNAVKRRLDAVLGDLEYIDNLIRRFDNGDLVKVDLVAELNRLEGALKMAYKGPIPHGVQQRILALRAEVADAQ